MNSLEAVMRQILRAQILRTCREAGEVGAGVQLMAAVFLKSGETGVTEDMVKAEAEYLTGKGLLSKQDINNKALGIRRVIYRITPDGIDCLEGTIEVPGIELG